MLVEEKIIAEKNNVITLTYELRIKDKTGEVVEEITDRDPFSFIYGSGALLKKFEEKINKLQAEDSFEFVLNSQEAYGNWDENNLTEIPIESFTVNGRIDYEMLQVGNIIPLRDEAGNHYDAKVLSIGKDAVKMDFNHPLAGKDLYFSGKIMDIREATEEELAQGHVKKEKHEHGEEGCGCGSGCGCH